MQTIHSRNRVSVRLTMERRQQAEWIMDSGKAQHYHYAISWLERVRAACKISERETEWQVYRNQLLTRHQREYKLKAMLEAL